MQNASSNQQPSSRPRYFITPDVQEEVAAAVFQVLDGESDDRVGMGVFFSGRLAVTSAHVLQDEQQAAGSRVRVVDKDDQEMVLRVVTCDPAEDVDCAILELPMGQEDRPFLAPWEGDADLLTGRIDFVLASTFRGQLCFSEAPISVVSDDLMNILYCSATSTGNGGAPAVNRDGRLLGLHLTVIEEARMQKRGESLRDTQASQVDGYAQLCCGVLMSEVTKMLDSVSRTERS